MLLILCRWVPVMFSTVLITRCRVFLSGAGQEPCWFPDRMLSIAPRLRLTRTWHWSLAVLSLLKKVAFFVLGVENCVSLPYFSYKSTISFLVLRTLSTTLQDWWFPPWHELSSLFITMVLVVNRRGPSAQPWGAPVFSTNMVPIQTVWGLFVRKSNIPLQSVSWARLNLNVLFSSTASIMKQPFRSNNSFCLEWKRFRLLPPVLCNSTEWVRFRWFTANLVSMRLLIHSTGWVIDDK